MEMSASLSRIASTYILSSLESNQKQGAGKAAVQISDVDVTNASLIPESDLIIVFETDSSSPSGLKCWRAKTQENGAYVVISSITHYTTLTLTLTPLLSA